jgi:hypothetical protein
MANCELLVHFAIVRIAPVNGIFCNVESAYNSNLRLGCLVKP